MNEEVTVLNSIGGCASSQLFKIINSLGVESNRDHFHQGINFGRCKHTLYPPVYDEIEKAIFVMGDPVQSIISIFRRDMAVTHIENKGLPLHPTRTDNVEIHPQTKEIYRVHPQFVKNYTLEEYVRGGQDWFMTYEHIYNWTQRKTKYPILCVKSDVQWKYGKEIFVDFLGQQSVPSEYVQRDRNSTIDLVPENMKEEFTSILKDATELYNSLPEFTIL
jgi:hypothetical protein